MTCAEKPATLIDQVIKLVTPRLAGNFSSTHSHCASNVSSAPLRDTLDSLHLGYGFPEKLLVVVKLLI